MNMVIRGIDADFGEHQANSFFNDLHPTLKANYIMANPPLIFPTGEQINCKMIFDGNTERHLIAMQTMLGFNT